MRHVRQPHYCTRQQKRRMARRSCAMLGQDLLLRFWRKQPDSLDRSPGHLLAAQVGLRLWILARENLRAPVASLDPENPVYQSLIEPMWTLRTARDVPTLGSKQQRG